MDSGRPGFHGCYAYAVTGQRAEAIQILKEMEERYAGGESVGQYLARVHAGLGVKDQTFAWLEKDFKKPQRAAVDDHLVAVL